LYETIWHRLLGGIILYASTDSDNSYSFTPTQGDCDYDCVDTYNNTTESLVSSEYDENDNGSDFTQSQMVALTVTQSIAGLVSALGGLHMAWGAWKRRHQIFHRIVLALSIYTILYGIYNVWGAAAVPKGTPGISGARGNTTTCTIQGFLFNLTMTINFYYVFLSVHSWVVIIHNNVNVDELVSKQYRWIEYLVHGGVHLFPVVSSLYLLTQDSFNPIGPKCWIASAPFGCGMEEEEEEDYLPDCERGPPDPRSILWKFALLPTVFFLVFPTVVMLALVVAVYLAQPCDPNKKSERETTIQLQSQQSSVQEGDDDININTNINREVPPEPPSTSTRSLLPYISPKIVLKQSAIYLGAMYWIHLPRFVFYGLQNNNNNNNEEEEEGGARRVFWVDLWLMAIPCSQGLWLAFVYRYFASCPEDVWFGGASSVLRERYAKSSSSMAMQRASSARNAAAAATYAAATAAAASRRSNGSSLIQQRDASGSSNGGSNDNDNDNSMSLNIFDGTNSGGAFRAFIFSGDSDDEESDMLESMHWVGCQGIIGKGE